MGVVSGFGMVGTVDQRWERSLSYLYVWRGYDSYPMIFQPTDVVKRVEIKQGNSKGHKTNGKRTHFAGARFSINIRFLQIAH